MVLLKPKIIKIASKGDDGNISISSYDLVQKKWKRNVCKEEAHIDNIWSLCTSFELIPIKK